jgi:hypothetical protein
LVKEEQAKLQSLIKEMMKVGTQSNQSISTSGMGVGVSSSLEGGFEARSNPSSVLSQN